jgi:hypothetical protein
MTALGLHDGAGATRSKGRAWAGVMDAVGAALVAATALPAPAMTPMTMSETSNPIRMALTGVKRVRISARGGFAPARLPPGDGRATILAP